MQSIEPVGRNSRIPGLDVLRGFALLGILIVNSLQMFIPNDYANDPVAVVVGETGVWTSWFVVNSLFDLKFLGLFTILFAAGFALQWQKYENAPGRFRNNYLRRLLILAAFGVGHALFLYSSDVLFLYAWVGWLLFLCRRWKSQTMISVGTGLLMVTMLESYVFDFTSVLYASAMLASVAAIIATVWLVRGRGPWVFIGATSLVFSALIAIQIMKAPEIKGPAMNLQQKQQIANELMAMPEGLLETTVGNFELPLTREMVAEVDQNGVRADRRKLEQVSYQNGPFWRLFELRSEHFTNLLLFFALYLSWRTFGMFLIVAGLVKWGLLDGDKQHLWRSLAVWGLGIGLPLTLLGTALQALHFDSDLALLSLGTVLHEASSFLLCGGMLGLGLLWSHTRVLAGAQTLFAAAGRLALSNYIGQSVVMSAIATSSGLAWFGRLSHWQLLGLSVLVYLSLAGASWIWLRYFRMGPLEWIWRCGTYWQWFPLRRHPLGAAVQAA